ncbi:MAG TPA: branched-chain amino acid ABC transporter permease [Stellaceae bacterium]|nr:branched-chain amino acid ABC transporter permease [Stellaceae bacterium]
MSLLASQILIGLINGSFYALLSLGMAVIFGLLNVINFAHGAFYMMGAFLAWIFLQYFGLSYWAALILSPLLVGIIGLVVERTMLARLRALDHIYGWLATFGLALMIESVFRFFYGVSGKPYAAPMALRGGFDLDFMFLPIYRFWVILASAVLCLGTWLLIERTRLGSYLRAAVENPALVQAFGVNVPRLLTLAYGMSVGLAALAGVLAAPVYQVTPLMGSQIIVTVFAVVVIGGLGSILGTIVTGFALGFIEGLTKVVYPQGANLVVFVVMAIVLLATPAGLFGRR